MSDTDETYARKKLERELMEMMQRCTEEIKGLRRTVDQLRPRAEAYENLAALIDMFPKKSVSMGEDLAWKLDRRIAELKEKIDAHEG